MKIAICAAEEPDVLAAVLRNVQSNSLLGPELVIVETAEHDLSELVRVELVAELGWEASEDGDLKMDGKRHTAAVLAYHRMLGLSNARMDSAIRVVDDGQGSRDHIVASTVLSFPTGEIWQGRDCRCVLDNRAVAAEYRHTVRRLYAELLLKEAQHVLDTLRALHAVKGVCVMWHVPGIPEDHAPMLKLAKSIALQAFPRG